MKSSLKKQAERFLREQKNYKRWLAVFVCLAVVVTIGTTAALKYKGIAVTSDDSATEAMHMDQTEGNTDEIPEGMRRHVHTEACYEEQLVLVCEAAKAEAEEGETADAGAADTETSDAGTADSGASDTGAAPEESEPADTAQGHTHSDDCYEVTGGTEKLTCTKEEHTHGDGCYETKTVTETVTKTVPETVTEEVKNEDGSVSTVEKTVDKTVEETVEKEEKVLTCTKKEHTHGASCYTVEGGERTLVCGKEEGEGAAAPATVNADAATVPAAETVAPAAAEAPAESASAAAETTAQTTTESTAAEAPAESADTEAAEAPTENADTETAGNTGVVSAENTEAAEAPAGEHVHDDSCYEPQMVLICGKEEGELEPIEPLSDEMNLVQTAETENYSVTVTYSESAMIPEEAVLQVFEYAKDSEQYAARCAELGYQPDFLLNIGFFVDGSEVEPQKTVDVKIIDKNVDNADGYEIVHFAKDGMEQIENDAAEIGDGMEMNFSTDSFTDWAGFALQRETSGDQVAEVAPIGELVHEKKVEPFRDEDGNLKYYELTLNVVSAVANSDEKAKLDIVFVVDTSGSMAWDVDGNTATQNKPSRRKLAKDAITTLVNDLDEADSGIDAQYKLITFSSRANTGNAKNWHSGDALKNVLPGSASGGTNYEDALEKAGEAVADKRDGAKTVVIFLTDGAPTYYNSPYYNWDYTRGGDGSTTTIYTVDGAKRGAGKITSDYFFAVGFGAEMTKGTKIGDSGQTAAEILDGIAAEVNGEGNASATTDLTTYFSKFKESLKRIVAQNVEFTDRLTPEVSIVDGNGIATENPGAGDWELEIKDENGNPLAKSDPEYNRMIVTYDTTNGLKVAIKDGKPLKQGYTYAVKTKIAPNSNAEDKFDENGYMYPDTGDKNTGSESSGKQGIRCNVEGSANVSYEYVVNGTPTPKDPAVVYPYPVVQLLEERTPPALVEQEMTHDKYIKKVEGQEDVYDLTLDLTGRVGTKSEPSKYDILFVVDTSGSMSTGDATITTTKEQPTDKLICTQEEHRHTNACRGTVPNCGKEEHSHRNCSKTDRFFGHDSIFHTCTDDCYTCGKKAHTHTSSCYPYACGKTEHQHTSGCYETTLVNTTDRNQERMLAAKTAIKDLVKGVEGNTNIDAEYNLVEFATTASTATGWEKNINDSFINKIDELYAGGGTNYHDALVKAGSAIANNSHPGREKATKVVIFLTDGKPTVHLCDPNKYGHNLSNNGKYCCYDGEETDKYDYQGALNGAETITCQYFYTIGLGRDISSTSAVYTHNGVGKTCKDILNDVARKTNSTVHPEAETVTDLKDTFDRIQGTITEFHCHDVTVTDKLSDYVEVNTIKNENGDIETPAKLKIEIYKINSDGTKGELVAESSDDQNVTTSASVIAPKTSKNSSANNNDRKIEARYDPATKQIVLDFPPTYKLESGYRYYVTVRIRASEEAYKQAENLPNVNGTQVYPNTGGPGTDHPDNNPKISEGQQGFFTNVGAEVKFLYDDKEGGETEEYYRPVIRVNPAKLTLKKTVSGLDGEQLEALLQKMSFVVDNDTAHPVKAVATSKVENTDGSITYTIFTNREVVPGKHTVTEVWETVDIDDYIRTTELKIGEGEFEPAADSLTAEVELEANKTGVVEFKNSYEARTELIQLKKVDEDGNSKAFEGLRFAVRKGSVVKTDDKTGEVIEEELTEEQLKAAVNALPIVAKLEIDANGNAVLKEVAQEYKKYEGNTVDNDFFELPPGTYTVEEVRTDAKPFANYAEVYPFEWKVLPNGNIEKNDILGFPNGENVSEPVSVKIDGKDGYQFTVINKQMELAELRILKVSSDRNKIEGLKGAKFDLYKAQESSDGNIDTKKGEKLNGNEPLVTDSSGVIKGVDCLKKLKAGEAYYLKEIEAPAGYELLEKEIAFKVSVVRDPKSGNQMQITGADGSRAYVVRGNLEYVRDENGNIVRDENGKPELEYVRDEDGNIVRDENGKPEPVITYVKYDSAKDEFQYSTDENGKYWTLAVVNNTGAELPVTGGPGTTAYTFGGLAMIIAVSLMYGLSMRRKREKGGLN